MFFMKKMVVNKEEKHISMSDNGENCLIGQKTLFKKMQINE